MGLLLVVLFLDILGTGIMFAVLPFLALSLGASAPQVTLLFTMLPLMQLGAAPLLGVASDRWGRRPVLLLGFVGAALSLTILAVASELWMLFAARALAGVVTANIPAGQGYIADITRPDQRARGMGFVGGALALGFIVGSAVVAGFGGEIGSPGMVRILSLAPALPVGAALLTLLVLREPLSRAERLARRPPAETLARRRRVAPAMMLLGLLLLMLGSVVATLESTLALWTNAVLGWGPRQFGALLGIGGLIAAVVQAGATGPLVRRFGEVGLLRPALVALVLGLLIVAGADDLVGLAIAMVLISVGLGLSNPVMQSLLTRHARADLAGGAIGVGESLYNLARFLGPLWAGFLLATLGLAWPYLVGAGIVGVVLVIIEIGAKTLVPPNSER
ncbi:MAG: MFS transporter [Alphaproteobacteria bacterium]